MVMKIVVGLDGSELSRRAVEWCALLEKATVPSRAVLGMEFAAVGLTKGALRRDLRPWALGAAVPDAARADRESWIESRGGHGEDR